jgi:hypothetical protein
MKTPPTAIYIMKNPIFFALVFLTLAYCAGFVIIALVLVVGIDRTTSSTTGINAQNLAPIFEPVPSIKPVQMQQPCELKPLSGVAKCVSKKPTLASVIADEWVS